MIDDKQRRCNFNVPSKENLSSIEVRSFLGIFFTNSFEFLRTPPNSHEFLSQQFSTHFVVLSDKKMKKKAFQCSSTFLNNSISFFLPQLRGGFCHVYAFF
jgi:hypothetical protein